MESGRCVLDKTNTEKLKPAEFGAQKAWFKTVQCREVVLQI